MSDPNQVDLAFMLSAIAEKYDIAIVPPTEEDKKVWSYILDHTRMIRMTNRETGWSASRPIYTHTVDAHEIFLLVMGALAKAQGMKW